MGVLHWIRKQLGQRQVKSESEIDALADGLAVDTVNRLLAPFALYDAHRVALQREAAFMLSSITFCCLALHPQFDEESSCRFFNKFLNHLHFYGHDAGLWPGARPGVLGTTFPGRMESHVEILTISDPTDSDRMRRALHESAALAAASLGSEVRVPKDFISKLEVMGVDHWDATLYGLLT